MKRTSVFLLIMLFTLVMSSLFATSLLTEDFSGTVGTALTANGWTLHSGSGSPYLISTPGLNYSGYAGDGIGNAASTGGTSDDVNKAFTSTNSGTLYMAFMYKPTAASLTSDYSVAFGNTSGATVSGLFGRFSVQKDASNALRFGIARQTGTVGYTGYNYAIGTTYLIVIKYEIVSSTANDIVSLFVNPTLGGSEPTATLINTTDTSGDPAQLTSIVLRQSTNTAGAVYDGIRVGTTWSDIASASLATEPTAQPTSLVFNTVTSTSFNAAFTAASGSPAGYIAIRKAGSAPTSDPVDGNAYTAGTTLGDGTVAYSGSGVSFSESGLSPSTTYYYKVYSFNGSAGTTNYYTTAPLANSQATSASVTPTITLSSSTLTGFTYVFGAGPSTTQTFTVSGANLSADISIAASTDYEISKSIDSGYTTPLTFTQSGGTVSTTTVYVRLKAGLAVASYNSEVITASSASATNQTVTCSGSVTAASAPATPVATAAASVTDTGFSSNWNVASGATSYRLDVYTGSAGGTTSDLFISEYVEGTSNNKAIEIYNGTGAAVDLSTYSLKKQANGAGAYANELVLSGTLANNDVYITANTLANATILALADNTNNTVTAFNGNDAIGLFKNGTQIDVVGIYNQVTPNWGADVTLVRKGTITSPSLTYSTSDWDSYAVDTFTYLGSHSLARTITYVSGYQDLNVGNVLTYPVTGLTASTGYHYLVRAVNGTGTSSNSNVIDVTTGSAAVTEPTAQPTSIGFNTVTSSSYNVTYTAASPAASYYLAVRKAGSAPTTDPSDGTAYTAGNTLGDGTIAYSGSSVSFSESGLSTSTTYYYKIYSFNGTGTSTNYLITSPLAGSQATASLVVAPSVTTTAASSIAQTTATSGGNVTADGGASVTARGVCWSTSLNPTTADSHTTDTSGTGLFTSSITSLTANTLYHVRAYATNSVNTSYGSDLTFTTLAVAPLAPVATAATSVTNNSFTATWNASSGATSYRLDVSTGNTFSSFVGSYNDLTVAGTTQNVTGLSASTTYFYRVRAVNTGGTSISSNIITQATTATDPFNGYYSAVTGLNGTALKAGLHTILRNTHTTEFSYANLETQLKVTDEDPNNSSNVIEIYTGWSVPKSSYGGGVTDWNKEHTWSKSHGFSEAAPAGTDLHHLRPSDATVNSAKSNRDFDEATTPYTDASPYGSYSGVTGCYTSTDIWEPRDVEKGDVARMLFYMAVRYEGDDTSYDLELLDSVPTSGPYYGKLSTLLSWAAADPPDAWEALRNNRIQGLQGNRNPFIDHPEWVASIWGGGASVPTVTTTAITTFGTVTASGGGNVTNDGGATVSARGVCWNTTGTPFATDSHTTDSSGTGVFASSLTSLTANTLYYVRAYATNSIGTAYGDPVTFTTLKVEPTAHVSGFAAGTTTSVAIPLTWTDAANTDTYLIKGSSVGFSSITAPTDGVVEADGALVKNVTQGLQTYTFTGLTASTTYYFKIYPYNNTTTSVNYKTDGSVPQVSAATAAVVPTITVTPPTMTFSSNVGVASAYQTATVASSDLSAGITVSSTGPFTFCLTTGGTYTNPLSLSTNFNGNVYIKFTPVAATTYTDEINFVSGTASDTIVPSATGTTASESALLTENFDYTAGTLLTANGWTNHSGTSNYIPVSATGLTYSGYPSSGGSASLLTSGEDVNRTFTAQTSGSVYASLLLNVTSSQTAGDYLFHFGTNAWSTSFAGRLYVKKDASTTNYALGINRGTTASAIYTGFNYVPGTTYLAVLKYTFVDGLANDQVDLFVNPVFPGAEPAANLTISTADAFTDPSNIGGVGIRQGSGTSAAVALLDGIRVATSWAMLFPSGTPTLTVNSTMTSFSTVAGNPSTSQSYTVSGTNLTGNIGIQAPTGFELSTTNADPWTSSLSLTSSYRGVVYVRLNHATPGTYSGNLVHTSLGATTINTAVTGQTTAPGGVITVVQSLTPFSTLTGTPSTVQTYTLTGTGLSGLSLDIASATTAGATFQIRAAEGDGVWHTSLSLLPTFDGVIEVRFNPTVTGTYNGTLTHSSDGVVDNVVNVSGIASNPTPTISVLPTTMSFSVNSGSTSAAQSATITSANLTLPIDITSNGQYTFCATETGTYTSTLQKAVNYNGTFWIKFAPTSIGTTNSTITLTSGTHTATISTTGYSLDPGSTVAPDLFISEYIEGSSNNKGIEIFNGTGHAVNLSTYRIANYYNGLLTPFTLVLGNIGLANGSCYTVVINTAGAALLALADSVTTSSAVNFNGDDAVVLEKTLNGTDWSYVDIFGRIGNDPGTEWTGTGGYTTKDKTLVRKSSIYNGITVSPTGTGPTAFTTLTTEWDLYNVDTFTNFGIHTFAPGATPAIAPTILPASGIKVAPVTVTMTSPTVGAQIRYTTDNSDPTETSSLYSTSFEVSSTTTVKARTYASGFAPSSISSAQYIYPTNVVNIAALRALTAGTGTYYKLTGEVVLTLKSATRNTKYVQDATGAVLIDDLGGVITTSYNVGDGITGLIGTIAFYTGMLQFTPAADPGIASSTGNVVTPEVVTLASLSTTHQAKLVSISDVSFTAAAGNFAAIATNYPITDASGSGICRNQYVDLDYMGTPVPTTPKTIVGVILQYTTGTPAVTVMQFVPRSLAEFTDGTAPDAPVNVTLTIIGSDLTISWTDDPTVTSWTVWASDTSPVDGFTALGTYSTNSHTYVGEASIHSYRYYYVKANR